MNKTHTVKIRVDPNDGPSSLLRSHIDATSITLPEGMSLDAEGGTVQWVSGGHNDLIEFTYDHFWPAQVQVSSNKDEVDADGVEQFTLTVTCEDPDETTIPIAVYESGVKIGSFDVTVSGGTGTSDKTIAAPGTYKYVVDLDVKDSVWTSMRKFDDWSFAIVEGVEV